MQKVTVRIGFSALINKQEILDCFNTIVTFESGDYYLYVTTYLDDDTREAINIILNSIPNTVQSITIEVR